MEAIVSPEEEQITKKRTIKQMQLTGQKILNKLQNGLTHQERIDELSRLSIERLVDVNNTLFSLIRKRNPQNLSQLESQLFIAIEAVTAKNNKIIILEEIKIGKSDVIGWRRIAFLGISS